MLTPDYLDKIPNNISRLYLEMENWTLQEIAERISKTGRLHVTSAYQLDRLNAIRQFDNDYKKRLSELTGETESEIENIFKDAASTAHDYDKYLFDALDKPFIPYESNYFLQQLTYSTARRMNDNLANISQTMGMALPTGEVVDPRTYFTRTLDKTVLQVASGALDYDTAIKKTISTMVDNGITVVDYKNNRKERIEGVIRRAVLTGVSNMAGEVNWRNAKELGAEHVETSAHEGARTGGTEPGSDHQKWQGRIFALNGFRP